MSRETVRAALTAAVEAAKASFSPGYALVIEYDNRVLVDTKTQKDPFLVVRVVFEDGEQADLAPKPIQRLYGRLELAAAVPEGAGAKLANQLVDHFSAALQMKQFGPVRLRMASPAKDFPHLNSRYYPTHLPFWADIPT